MDWLSAGIGKWGLHKKYKDESQNWLEILDDILFSVPTAKHCLKIYILFCMIYNRDPMTPFDIADN